MRNGIQGSNLVNNMYLTSSNHTVSYQRSRFYDCTKVINAKCVRILVLNLLKREKKYILVWYYNIHGL